MKAKRILTRDKDLCLDALFEDGKLVEMNVRDFDTPGTVGQIYVGRVENIVPDIGAVFVEYQKKETAFLELSEAKSCHIGDPVIIAITREASGSKPPRCTTHLSLSGQFAVLVTDRTGVFLSKKIKEEGRRKELKELGQSCLKEDIGFILRTAAENAPDSVIKEEMTELSARYEEVKRGIYLTPFTLLYSPPAPYLSQIPEYEGKCKTEILTDQEDVYQAVKNAFPVLPEGVTVRLYEEKQVSLFHLYGMQAHLKEALSRRVYLKSGAFLVIDQTEAMTVIDVNSGKASAAKKGKKKEDRDEALFRIDLEAAKETARQLRLRNLSGIIVVDFIDLSEERERLLEDEFARLLLQDPVQTDFVEMTKLQFAVVTRKKVRMPLSEQIKIEKNRGKEILTETLPPDIL